MTWAAQKTQIWGGETQKLGQQGDLRNLKTKQTLPTDYCCLSAKLVRTFAGRRMSRDQRNGSLVAVNLRFLDRIGYLMLLK
jgi:hypothetical protein